MGEPHFLSQLPILTSALITLIKENVQFCNNKNITLQCKYFWDYLSLVEPVGCWGPFLEIRTNDLVPSSDDVGLGR